MRLSVAMAGKIGIRRQSGPKAHFFCGPDRLCGFWIAAAKRFCLLEVCGVKVFEDRQILQGPFPVDLG